MEGGQIQIAYSVALIIGAAVVGWCANRIVALGERVAALEAKACSCGDEKDKIN